MPQLIDCGHNCSPDGGHPDFYMMMVNPSNGIPFNGSKQFATDHGGKRRLQRRQRRMAIVVRASTAAAPSPLVRHPPPPRRTSSARHPPCRYALSPCLGERHHSATILEEWHRPAISIILARRGSSPSLQGRKKKALDGASARVGTRKPTWKMERRQRQPAARTDVSEEYKPLWRISSSSSS